MRVFESKLGFLNVKQGRTCSHVDSKFELTQPHRDCPTANGIDLCIMLRVFHVYGTNVRRFP